MTRSADIDDAREPVLVVEDELFIAMELREILTSGGFRVLGPVASVDLALDLMPMSGRLSPCWVSTSVARR
jgi:two-component system, response regulator PdtaR